MYKNTPRANILQVSAAMGTGGVELCVAHLAAFVQQKGAQSIVASSGGSKVKALKEQGINHITLPLHKRSPLAIWHNSRALTKLISEYNIHLVHAHSRAPAWAAWLACRRTKTPFVTTMAGAHRANSWLKRLYNSVMLRSDAVCVVSPFLKNHVQATYGTFLAKHKTPLHICPLGVDVPKFANAKPYTHAALGLPKSLPKNALLFAHLGRQSAIKGQTETLHALAQLRTHANTTPLPPWHCLFIGGGAKLAENKALAAQLGLSDHVTFLGARDDVPRLMQSVDIALTPSQHPESFGLAPLEALAAGKPVIACAHGGVSETVQQGVHGLLVPPKNVPALAQALQHFLAMPPSQRRAMGKNGQDHVRQNHNFVHQCHSEWAIYQGLLVKGLPK